MSDNLAVNVIKACLLLVGLFFCGFLPTMLFDAGVHHYIASFIGVIAFIIWLNIAIKWWHSGEEEENNEIVYPLIITKGMLTKVIEADGTIKVTAHERWNGTQEDLKAFAEEPVFTN